LIFTKLLAGYVTEDYMKEQHVIDYIIKDHDLQYYVIIEDHVKDHPEE